MYSSFKSDALDWIDSAFTRRDAANCFVWVRMRVSEDGSVGMRRQAIHLWYEDFLEAIVRVATMKPLPTMQEIIFAGMNDCGEYIMDLKVEGGAQAYERFLAENPISRGDPPEQDTADLVEHVIMLIQRTIELNLGKRSKVSESEDGVKPLTKKEVERFHTLSLRRSASGAAAL